MVFRPLKIMTKSLKFRVVALVLPVMLLGLNSLLAKENAMIPKETELAHRVKALEERLEQLERTLGQKNIKEELEARARMDFSAIRALVAEDKFDNAKSELERFLRSYDDPRTTPAAQSLAKELSVIGSHVPATWGIEKWFQGGEAALKSRQEPTLLVFWETWCVYCRQQLPEIQALYEELKAEGLEIVGLTTVSGSATERGVQKIINRFNLSFPVAKEDGSIGKIFVVSGIPMAAVFKEGKIIWRGHPGRLTQKKIRSWL